MKTKTKKNIRIKKKIVFSPSLGTTVEVEA